MWLRSLGQEDPLEEGMAVHSSILAWRIPWTEEPGRLLVHSIAQSLSTAEQALIMNSKHPKPNTEFT